MKRAALVVLLAVFLVAFAGANEWKFGTYALAYNGQADTLTTFDLQQWQAQGMSIDQSDEWAGHPNDPQFTGATSRVIFDQSNPTDASMRLFARAGRGYGAQSNTPINATSELNVEFDLSVENLSGQDLNIVLGNRLHGVFATMESAEVSIAERTTIGWFGTQEGKVEKVDYDDVVESGMFLGTTDFGLLDDPYFSVVEGYDFNSFYFYGSRLFAPGEKAVTSVEHYFSIRSELRHGSGLAIVDMMNTGNFVVRAYDDFGNDRTADIRVGIVPEPATMAALGLGLAALARRRRPRKD